MQSNVRLIRGQDSITIEADLVELRQKHADEYTSRWKEQLSLHGQEDKFWDWEFKLQFVISRQPNREGFAIEYEDETQGLMIIEIQMHGSRLAPGKRLVYVDGIASAPWNREVIQRPPKYKGVGTALLSFARTRSLELGFEGRVGLHSLPGAEKFYERQGMIDLGADEDYDDLVYFEYGLWRSSSRRLGIDEST
ncbi:MAG: GNAT family N-acetyltransferase [Nostoc sp. TH1S01]|uniref:GNAT family N-acetyltransferase n=1 Tax=Nostoc sp. FACHB-280 TaxID=2692839 RepID=UPI00168B6FB4|nr:GNAT family N-acetyltransferase [Nostoc sp. FACHB-280]MBD2496734.1 GNAT family N-acetyltransferase [Nostoc sp. FACHB-280]MBU7587546.1 GNAT family N-acetyltransferase [Nostoc sp. TH1S01]